MASILIVAELFKGEMKKATLNAITFGKDAADKLGQEMHLLVLGSGIANVAEELATYGAKQVHVADDEAFANYTCEPFAQVVTQVAKEIDAQWIGATATVFSKDLLPRVAGRLGAAMASDIVEMLPDGTIKRPIWAGAVIAHQRLETDLKVVTVRGTSFDAAQPGTDKSPVNQINVQLDQEAIKVKFVKLEETQSERPELTEASVVVSGGRGMKNEEGVKLIGDLADTFGAAMGASRAAVDAGMVPNDLQVGQTGKVVAPDLYVAVGLSGAIQHLAGMKSSKVIVAINKDPEAPIFQVADYGLVADLFKAVPEMMEEVKKAKSS